MRILLVCHYFAPEPGAPQARLLETARAFQEAGHAVDVLTGFPNHPTGVLARSDRGRLVRVDRLAELRVVRSWLYATPNRGFLKKTLGHLSFMATAVPAGLAFVRRPDVIVASSPTFFSVLSAWALSRLWRRPFVFEVRDLWPAIFTELGVLTNPRIIRALTGMEEWLYRAAGHVVTVTDGFRDDLVRRGIAPEKVTTITNGVDLSRWTPAGDAVRAAGRRELGADGRFLVLYIGAHGISQALSRVLDAAARLRDDPEIRFALVGEGAEKEQLVAKAKTMGLENVAFFDPVDKDGVARCLAAADLCLVPLRDVPLFTTFIPSKMFEIMGCGRPILGSVAGEAARILERSGAAAVVPPEDDEAMAAAISAVKADPVRRARMADAGVRFAAEHYDRRRLAHRYLEVLEATVAESRR